MRSGQDIINQRQGGLEQSLSGKLTASPAATSPTSGVFYVLVRGTDGAIWERTTTNGGSSCSAWSGIGGNPPQAPALPCAHKAAVSTSSCKGTDGALWHKTYTGTSWSGWQSLSGGNSPPHPPRPHRQAVCSMSLSAAPTAPFGRGRPPTEAHRGAPGPASAGNSPQAPALRRPQGSRLDVFVQSRRTAPYGIKLTPARRGLAGNPSAGHRLTRRDLTGEDR